MENTRLYESNDMVRIGCHGCVGCSDCCRDMGESVLLDPYDICRLSTELNQSFEELLSGPVEIHSEMGLPLPNLKMNPDCYYLNEEGRCGIHSFRPGICRLFPLGRNYTPDHVNYFLLENACKTDSKTKMKVSKWLDTPNLKEYEAFLVKWHNLTKALRQELCDSSDETFIRQTSTLFLNLFYGKPYTYENFFEEFDGRASLLGY